jgi:hypothetical protein
MRILETIARSLREQTIHPTNALNALIELENNAGIGAISDLEYRLARLVRAMREREDTTLPLAQAWLSSSRAYLEEYGRAMPIQMRPPTMHEKVLRAVTVGAVTVGVARLKPMLFTAR